MRQDNAARKSALLAQGVRLRRLRQERGISQERAGETIGLRQCDISRIESGGGTHVRHLVGLAELYDTTLDYIVRGVEPAERVGAA